MKNADWQSRQQLNPMILLLEELLYEQAWIKNLVMYIRREGGENFTAKDLEQHFTLITQVHPEKNMLMLQILLTEWCVS